MTVHCSRPFGSSACKLPRHTPKEIISSITTKRRQERKGAVLNVMEIVSELLSTPADKVRERLAALGLMNAIHNERSLFTVT